MQKQVETPGPQQDKCVEAAVTFTFYTFVAPCSDPCCRSLPRSCTLPPTNALLSYSSIITLCFYSRPSHLHTPCPLVIPPTSLVPSISLSLHTPPFHPSTLHTRYTHCRFRILHMTHGLLTTLQAGSRNQVAKVLRYG